jgi:hypothetical protein
LKHYADLHTPEIVSLEHWKITPSKVEAYLKTEKWRQVLRDASKIVPELDVEQPKKLM